MDQYTIINNLLNEVNNVEPNTQLNDRISNRLAEIKLFEDICINNILDKYIITPIEFNKLPKEAQNIYEPNATKRVEDGIQSYYMKILSYKQKAYHKMYNLEPNMQLNDRISNRHAEIKLFEENRINNILDKYIITPVEFNKLPKEAQNIYESNETKRVEDGIQSYYMKILSYKQKSYSF